MSILRPIKSVYFLVFAWSPYHCSIRVLFAFGTPYASLFIVPINFSSIRIEKYFILHLCLTSHFRGYFYLIGNMCHLFVALYCTVY